jgi:hypothetical protein
MPDLLTVDRLPKMAQGERGGPRYVQVVARARAWCTTCRQPIAAGALHVYDRVRLFGAKPRRYCRACWDAAPKAQVLR